MECDRPRNRLSSDDEGRVNRPSDDEIKPRLAVLEPIESKESVLKVSSVDYLTKENRLAHHTDRFQQDGNILRRGDEFRMCITFDRKINHENDGVILQFTHVKKGQTPQESKGTIVRIPLDFKEQSKDQTGTWIAKAHVADTGNQLVCAFTSPPDCSIGKYDVYIETKFGDNKGINRYKEMLLTVILFNPWIKEDTVYMEGEKEKDEYVLNETGFIWIGSMYYLDSRPWNFGQFQSPALEVALRILEKAELSAVALTSPVSVIRCLSARVNSNDDNGVLTGRWSEEYPDDCTVPWEWTGSIPILTEYYSSEKPVRFGQCWVFSAVATTLCRCLGIPTRSVTNFASAHDHDCSMTIDFHFDENLDPMEGLNDSIWNFHVWNESWFRRLDLPDGYDGWQVHDATPQESSEGIMRCGPAPVRAVKEGHVYLNYDVGFIFAEVNADKVKWMLKKDGEVKVTGIEKNVVGKFISTKCVGSNKREDITCHYKYEEGSEDERRVVHFVNRFSTRRKENVYNLAKPVQLEFTFNTPDNTMIGDSFDVLVIVKNILQTSQYVRITMTLVNAYYTGVCGKRVKVERKEGEIGAGNEMKFVMTVATEDYIERMNPEGRFHCFITAKNINCETMETADKSFLLKKPKLVIQAPKTTYLKAKTKVFVTFKNTTPLTLEEGKLHLEGHGLTKTGGIFKKLGKIAPGKEMKEEFVCQPSEKYYSKYFPTKTFVATFTSKRLRDLTASANIEVHEPSKSTENENDD